MQTGGPGTEGRGVDGPRIEAFLRQYKPDHLTGPERLEALYDFQEALVGEISRIEELESGFGDLIARINRAETLHELKNLHCDLTALAIRDFQETGSVKNLQGKCTHFGQEITCRLIQLVERQMVEEGYGSPPSTYAWISMGADGRREQTILTDQDSLLVYRDITLSQNRERFGRGLQTPSEYPYPQPDRIDAPRTGV